MLSLLFLICLLTDQTWLLRTLVSFFVTHNEKMLMFTNKSFLQERCDKSVPTKIYKLMKLV